MASKLVLLDVLTDNDFENDFFGEKGRFNSFCCSVHICKEKFESNLGNFGAKDSYVFFGVARILMMGLILKPDSTDCISKLRFD